MRLPIHQTLITENKPTTVDQTHKGIIIPIDIPVIMMRTRLGLPIGQYHYGGTFVSNDRESAGRFRSEGGNYDRLSDGDDRKHGGVRRQAMYFNVCSASFTD